MDSLIEKNERNGEMSARFILDLDSHIFAYKSYDDSELKHSHFLLDKEVRNSHFTFSNIIAEATRGQTEEIIEIIKKSPAHYYLKKEFAELLKNAIDSKLKPFMDESYHGTDTVLILDIKIELDPSKQYVRFMISDNGTGFAEDKLLLINNKEAREASDYYRHVGSEKYALKGCRRLQIGGAGRGIRELMGLADKGDPTYGLDITEVSPLSSDSGDIMDDRAGKTTFTVPDVSNLSFYNKDYGRGAVIDIITSKEPLVFHQIENIEEKVVLKLPSKLRKKRNESPDTVARNPDADDPIKNSPY